VVAFVEGLDLFGHRRTAPTATIGAKQLRHIGCSPGGTSPIRTARSPLQNTHCAMTYGTVGGLGPTRFMAAPS
jgi:hypothetical protein